MTDIRRPPFRADHVGSLLRPAELLRARAEQEAGRLSAEELRRVEDAGDRRCCADAARGRARGCHRWRVSARLVAHGFLYRIGGVGKSEQTLNIRFRNEGGTVEFNPTAHRVGGKLRLDETIFGEDFAYLKSVAPEGTTPKLTIPSPSMLHYRGGRAAIDAKIYPDMDDLARLAQVYAAGNHGVARARRTCLELDEISLAYLNDPAQRADVDAIGGAGATQHRPRSR